MNQRKVKGKLQNMKGITLVVLVVTIVVLLILAGITITYIIGDNSVFKQASEAKLKTEIANWKERLEVAKSPIFIEGLGTFEPDKYFEYIQQQGIINNKDTDVINNGDGTYDVTTKPGYVFLVTLMPTPEKPTDAEIEYIGQAGEIAPIIKRIDVSATQASITGKAVVARLGNGTIKYYYKATSADDSTYQEITNVNVETGATQSTGITAGESYTIKVVAKNDVGEVELTEEIVATKIFVESITLNKKTEVIGKDKFITLIATVKPDDATNKNVTWKSSDESVATVNDSGIVSGIAAGTATITASATDGSNKFDTCLVTVKSVSLNRTTETVSIGIGKTLKATVFPNDSTSENVTWTSADSKIATVDEEGVVTGIAIGSTTITASTKDESNTTATCSVTVTATDVNLLHQISSKIAYDTSINRNSMKASCNINSIVYTLKAGNLFLFAYGSTPAYFRILGFKSDELLYKTHYRLWANHLRGDFC